jgi:uncharacterized membrane protein YecN with MAPEG domain
LAYVEMVRAKRFCCHVDGVVVNAARVTRTHQ